MILHFVWQSLKDGLEQASPLAPRRRLRDDAAHLDAAVGWLMRSIDAAGGTASSKAYRVGRGWMPPYPETSGYIVCTLLALWRERGEDRFRDTAVAIGDWLLSIQLPEGGFVGREQGVMGTPVVFNTGQILQGLVALDRELGGDHYRDAARRAARFLIACQDDTGCFVRHLSNDMIHCYNARTAWPMLELAALDGDDALAAAANANFDWVLTQQSDAGFFRNNGFKPGGNANSHGLAYVLEGLLGGHALTGRRDLLDAVARTADRLVRLYGIRKRIAAELDEDGRALSRHLCLTGYAQLAIVLFRLFPLSDDARHLNLGLHLLDDALHHQTMTGAGRPWHGGLKGSFPIYGRYAPLQYPNWAAKFLIDALMEKARVMSGFEDRLHHSTPGQR